MIKQSIPHFWSPLFDTKLPYIVINGRNTFKNYSRSVFFGIKNIHSVYMQKRCKELVIDIGHFANTLRQ